MSPLDIAEKFCQHLEQREYEECANLFLPMMFFSVHQTLHSSPETNGSRASLTFTAREKTPFWNENHAFFRNTVRRYSRRANYTTGEGQDSGYRCTGDRNQRNQRRWNDPELRSHGKVKDVPLRGDFLSSDKRIPLDRSLRHMMVI